VTLKYGLGYHSWSLEVASLDRLHTSSYSVAIITLFRIIFVIKRVLLVENRNCFIPHLHSTQQSRGPHGNIAIMFGDGRTRTVWLLDVKNFEDNVQPFRHNTGVLQRDRRADRQTFCDSIVRATHTRPAVLIGQQVALLLQRPRGARSFVSVSS